MADLPPADLRARWLSLTRERLPALATPRGWPIRADHCFQRVLLDVACGGVWYDRIAGRPAYQHAAPALLARAVELGEACVAGTADLPALNDCSLAWRRARKGATRPDDDHAARSVVPDLFQHPSSDRMRSVGAGAVPSDSASGRTMDPEASSG